MKIYRCRCVGCNRKRRIRLGLDKPSKTIKQKFEIKMKAGGMK